MDDNRIGEIVQKVFAKAKTECVSQKKSALSKHIANQIQENHGYISYRTLERAYDRHIIKDTTVSERNAESIDLFCQYLGFENYVGFIKNEGKTEEQEKPPTDTVSEPTSATRLKSTILVVIGIILLIMVYNIWPVNESKNAVNNEKCMTWADSVYVPISCDKGPLSTYGTSIDPLDSKKMKNFKKVEVNMATQFFSDQTNQPLIWYTKNKDDEIEYFTAPGLHPTTGKTLDEITEYIIEKYVPPHINRPGSFLKENWTFRQDYCKPLKIELISRCTFK